MTDEQIKLAGIVNKVVSGGVLLNVYGRSALRILDVLSRATITAIAIGNAESEPTADSKWEWAKDSKRLADTVDEAIPQPVLTEMAFRIVSLPDGAVIYKGIPFTSQELRHAFTTEYGEWDFFSAMLLHAEMAQKATEDVLAEIAAERLEIADRKKVVN